MTQKVVTHFVTKGFTSARTARELIALTSPTQRALDQTVELYDERDVIVKTGRYGETIFVRSSISAHRYLVILHKNGDYRCTCGESACNHVRQAIRYTESLQVA